MEPYIERSKIKRISLFQELSILIETKVEKKSFKLNPATNFKENKNHTRKEYDFNNISFSQDNVINSLEKLDNPSVLIFASAKNPGGGVVSGRIAQEEIISSHTTWYFQAKENKEFYSQKGASALNTDNISIAEGYLVTNQYHQEIEPKKVNFIACAAPNLTGIKSQNLKISDDIIYSSLNTRIRKILMASEASGSKNLILGAFGCGVFGLNPEKVAQCFKKNIEQGIYTGNIEFCILSKDLLDIFKKYLLVENIQSNQTVINSTNKSIKNKP